MFIEELTWRGLLYHVSDPSLAEKMRAERFTLYAGFDPTAPSLHIGHLLPLLTLQRAQKLGHRPIAVVGGATGMIGDPSGKTEERKLLDEETLAKNQAGLRAQLERFLDFSTGNAVLVNNYDWFKQFNVLDFLRRVGKHFSVNMMLGKESVRARLEDREHGISFTEFSYILIQSYDFLFLNEQHGCKLQFGGSDQWGNITAGIDLIRRVRHEEAFGVALPLVTDSSGKKFGKTEKGALWLDAGATSPYELYQYFLRADDRDAGKLLRFYTFLDEATIVALEETIRAQPEKREAQRVLAENVVDLVHGKDERVKAANAAGVLFGGGELASLDARTIEAIFADAPSSEEPRAALDAGLSLVDALAKSGLSQSKGAARKDIQGGGVYVNNVRADDITRALGIADLVAGRFVVLRKGKKSYHLLRFG